MFSESIQIYDDIPTFKITENNILKIKRRLLSTILCMLEYQIYNNKSLSDTSRPEYYHCNYTPNILCTLLLDQNIHRNNIYYDAMFTINYCFLHNYHIKIYAVSYYTRNYGDGQ